MNLLKYAVILLNIAIQLSQSKESPASCISNPLPLPRGAQLDQARRPPLEVKGAVHLNANGKASRRTVACHLLVGHLNPPHGFPLLLPFSRLRWTQTWRPWKPHGKADRVASSGEPDSQPRCLTIAFAQDHLPLWTQHG